jgi:hypothetical protein
LEEEMAIQVKRTYLDFVARNYTSRNPEVELVAESPGVSGEGTQAQYTVHRDDRHGSAFTLRCYLSLQGEDSPSVTAPDQQSSKSPVLPAEPTVYRYDWTFGITLIEGFYWDWMNSFPDNGALAIHLILNSETSHDGPEPIPVGAVLSTMHPSKNTKSLLEMVLPTVLKGTSDMAKIGAHAVPPLDYLSSALMLGSNVLESSSDGRKNWFLYQFFDEKQKCPVVEWRIYKEVLIEFGPLIRGTLFLAFHRPSTPHSGKVRIQLRPQIHYCEDDELCYIIPTSKLQSENQVFIDICPA